MADGSVFDPDIFALLQIHDSCRDLDQVELQCVADSGSVWQVDAGQIVHRAEQATEFLTLVLRGQIDVSFRTMDGLDQSVRTLGPGDQLGVLSILSGELIPLNVSAAEPTILFRIPRDEALKLIHRIPQFSRNLSRSLSLRLKESMVVHQSRAMSKLIACLGVNTQSRTIVIDLLKRLMTIGERIGVLTASSDEGWPASVEVHSIRRPDGGFLSQEELHELVNRWPQLDRIFLVADWSGDDGICPRLALFADEVLCFSGTRNYATTAGELHKLKQAAAALVNKTRLVWQLNPNEKVVPWIPEVADLVQRDFKVSLQRPELYAQSIDRLVHHLRGVQVGLVLSGGAARGMAHLGVLKALDEAGVTIDRISGASAGVLTGVMYCAGLSPDFATEKFAHDLQPGSIYQKLPGGGNWYVLNKYRSKSWDQMLRKYVFDWRLEQLPVPMHSVTTDLVSATQVVRDAGDAVDSILESINLPVLSPPICKDGMALVDGGVLNNLPADVLARKNCNFVIGVDVTSNIEREFGGNRPDTPSDQMKVPGAIATLMRCMNVQSHHTSAVGGSAADIVIQPDVSDFDPADFTKAPQMAIVGQRTVQDVMPDLLARLAALDSKLFST